MWLREVAASFGGRAIQHAVTVLDLLLVVMILAQFVVSVAPMLVEDTPLSAIDTKNVLKHTVRFVATQFAGMI